MHLSIFGLGYIGSILAGCMAQLGHTVIGLDANPTKTASLNRGVSPVQEPGLADLIVQGRAADRIRVSEDPVQAVMDTDLSLVCVGTPARADGSLDDAQLQQVIDQIAVGCSQKKRRHLIVVRSTALPFTHDALLARLHRAGVAADEAIGYVVHPEFLREGQGVEDFFTPAFFLYGGATTADRLLLDQLYPGLTAPVWHVDRATAATTKYAGNLFHAVKVAFANEIAQWAAAMGAEGQTVMALLTADHKLNLSAAYLRPGLPFGGSCLPKDLDAALHTARQQKLLLPILTATAQSNQLHGEAVAARLAALPQKRMLLLGLAFKPNTDDLRGSPLVLLARRLLDAGKILHIYAPEITLERLTGSNLDHIQRLLPELYALLVPDLHDAIAQADAVLIGHPLAPAQWCMIRASGTANFDLLDGGYA